MHSFTLAAAILPVLAAALPQNIPIPCGTNLGQMPCTDSGPTSTTVQVQTMTVVPIAAAPTTTVSTTANQPTIVTGDQSPEASMRASNHNSDVVTCKSSWDCNSFCEKSMNKTSGYGTTCDIYAPPGQSTDSYPGSCICYPSDEVDQMVIGLGEAVCLAVNDAIYDTVTIASYAIPYVGPEAGEAAQLFRIGSKIARKGAKDCGINVCPGHVYTVVDPEDFQSQAGILACD